MRVGKKPNLVETNKTRSCVVRLEKVAKGSTSPVYFEDTSQRVTRSNRLSISAMGATPKGRRTGLSTQHEEKQVRGPVKKRPIGTTSSNSSNLSTPQRKTSASNMAAIRSSQKIRVIPRSNKATPNSTPSREETPPPTIAAGRSRRAIKPNPKYASEDLVTSKVVRNVASSTNRRGSISSTVAGGDASKSRRASTSSDDFYNRNSEDDFENDVNDIDDDVDVHNDKSYQVNEKEQDDSDFSDIPEEPLRPSRPRGRPRRVQESTLSTPHQTNKIVAQTLSANVKRPTTTSVATSNSTNLRSAPSQLQQIRRTLANANAQRNINLLTGSGGNVAQKRKLEESHDSSDTESGYTIKRKQLLLSSSTGHKMKVSVRDNKINNTSTPLVKSRTMVMHKGSSSSITSGNITQPKQQNLNGGNRVNSNQTVARRAIETGPKSNNTELSNKMTVNQNNKLQSISTVAGQQNNYTTQVKMFATKNNRLRSNSPKPANLKEKQSSPGLASTTVNNMSKTSTSDKCSPSTSTTNLKLKSNILPADKGVELKDDSPNSTIDDFETMPTFTIVNVNDIINKKGDVLITKSKSNNNKAPSVIEFSESIDLDDEDEDDIEEIIALPPAQTQQTFNKRMPKLTTVNNRKEFENKTSPLTRSNESLRKLPTTHTNNTTSAKQAPQILNHKLGLRNSRVLAKTTTTLTTTLKTQNKPAPRILNSMVAKKTQPVKPMIANMDDSADESFPLSLDEDEGDEEEETEDEIESRQKNVVPSDKERKKFKHQRTVELDTEDTESQNTEEDDVVLSTNNHSNSASKNVALNPKQNIIQQTKKRTPGVYSTPIVVSSNKKRMTTTTTTATKENSLAATNQQITDIGNTNKQPISPALPRKTNAEKVVISRQGDKIIKKITCYETWYVINMPIELKRPAVMKNQLEMPLIRLANNAKTIGLPTDMWSSKVTLYELSPQTLGKSTFVTYTGDLREHNISEEDRGKYQPSCVMFRRSIEKNQLSRMPYDRAVIFKNKTFYTNIEGKNVRLVGAPSIINCENEIETLLEIVDALTLQSEFVEHISIVQ